MYTRNTSGIWEARDGNPETLIYGYGAHGDAGRVGSWDDGFVMMSPGDALYIRPEGGYKVKRFAVTLSADGVLESMPFEEYEQRAAVDSAETEVEFV